MSFLCMGHRNLAETSRVDALILWEATLEHARLYQHANHIEASIPYWGCVYELAEIILVKHYVPYEEALENYYEACVHLSESLLQMGMLQSSDDICKLTLERLGKLATEYPRETEHGMGRFREELQLRQLELKHLRSALGVSPGRFYSSYTLH